jgi:predicted nucleic acid-binding protein
MVKKSVYIETTIPSYATAKTSRDVIKAGRQAMTKLFWENARQNYDLYISQYVIDECSDGDVNAAKRRIDFIEGLTFINTTAKIEELAHIYQQLLGIPEDSKTDSFHLAVCVDAKIDYLLTWNYTHLGMASYRKLLEYNTKNGLSTPLLVTPEILNTKEAAT